MAKKAAAPKAKASPAKKATVTKVKAAPKKTAKVCSPCIRDFEVSA